MYNTTAFFKLCLCFENPEVAKVWASLYKNSVVLKKYIYT